MILPPRRIGILGSGQLARMTALAGARMGYSMHVLSEEAGSPAGPVCAREWVRKKDIKALERFASAMEVVTIDFENISIKDLEFCRMYCEVRPSREVLEICQHREREKKFLRDNGYPHAPFEIVVNAETLSQAVEKLGTPCVLKTVELGYDGKGQIKITSQDNLTYVWKEFGQPRGIVEAWLNQVTELSVICARNPQGEIESFPAAENIHTHHILDISIVPARLPASVLDQARRLAKSITENLKVEGLLAVEMFYTQDGKLLVNELAPRPHNSGHYTFDACITSQFEQDIRAICDLPLGNTELMKPVVMVNLLGDLWLQGCPKWEKILAYPNAKLHLYGKEQARTGRKMGHFCLLADSVEKALEQALEIKNMLKDNS